MIDPIVGAKEAELASWVRNEGGFGLLEGERVRPHVGDLFGDPGPHGERLALDGRQLAAPVTPGKFIGLWNNSQALAAKPGQPAPCAPLYFLKAGSAILAPGGIIRPPPGYAGRSVYEGELGIVIGRRCAQASEAEAARAIFGYTCVNDVTALDLISEDASFAQWARAKSCDTFGPVGPAIVTGIDPAGLVVRTLVNGRQRQNYPVADMILPPARIVILLLRERALLPGDLIACGTSLGVLPLRPGTEVSVAIDGIGTLANRFEAAEVAGACIPGQGASQAMRTSRRGT